MSAFSKTRTVLHHATRGPIWYIVGHGLSGITSMFVLPPDHTAMQRQTLLRKHPKGYEKKLIH